MLDKMRKHSRSFLIYIFFGIIIAVFVINFGPQSSGCIAQTTYAGQIDGRPLSLNDLNYAMAVVGLRGSNFNEAQLGQLRALVIDRLAVRELMAQEARDHGLRISNKEINDMLLSGRYLAMGEPRRLFQQGDEFDYDYFSRYVRYNWGITVLKFKEQQRNEMLAEKMRLLLRTATVASPEEINREYIHDNTRSNLQYVRLDPADFRKEVLLDDAEIDAFGRAHAKQIAERHRQNKGKGDVPLEQARPAIARELLAEQKSVQLVKQTATALIQKVKKGAKIEDLVPPDTDQQEQNQNQTLAPKPSQGAGDDKPELKLQTTGPFAKSFEHLVPGIGISEQISQLAFTLPAGAIADEPIAVATVYYVVVVKERREADMKAFAKQEDELTDRYEDRKWSEDLRQYELRLCETAVKERRLSINARVLAPAEQAAPGAPPPPAYIPCQSLRMM